MRFAALAAGVTLALVSPAVAGAEAPPDTTTPSRPSSTVPTTTVAAPAPTSTTIPLDTVPSMPGMETTVKLAALLPALPPVPGQADAAALRDRYGTLSGAMLQLWADESGSDLTGFLAEHRDGLADVFETPSLTGLSAATPADLDAQLSQLGVGVDFADTLDGYSAQVAERAKSLEAQVAAAGAAWATEIGTLRDPDLDTSALGDVFPEAATFGLFTNQATTAMVTDFPDLFAQVRTSGVGTDAAAAAWRESMGKAVAATTETSPSDGLVSPCLGALMTALGSGDATRAAAVGGDQCRPCVATGMYLNASMVRMFDPTHTIFERDAVPSILPPSRFDGLPAWQRDMIAEQNPGLRERLDSNLYGLEAQTHSAYRCNASNQAATAAAQVTLPGVFGELRLGEAPAAPTGVTLPGPYNGLHL